MIQTERKQLTKKMGLVNELTEKIGLVNELTEILCDKLRLRWDYDKESFIDSDNNEMDWCDCGSVTLDLDGFICVNFWGDCTIELQETNGEGVNIYNYNVATVTAVVNALK